MKKFGLLLLWLVLLGYGGIVAFAGPLQITGQFSNPPQPGKLWAGPTGPLFISASDTFTTYLPIILVPALNPKKGVGVVAAPACQDVLALRASWYLNWGVFPDPTCIGAEHFVPRIFGAGDMQFLAQAVANAQASGWLIGFSEPNLPWQGNLSPTQGAILWKQIEQAALPAGIKLVSPSPNQYPPGQADPYGHQWLWAMVQAYQAQNGGQNPHFDAMGWNIYSQNPGDIQNYLTARHNEALARGYDVPIWVLEYGGECWKSASGNTGNQAIVTTSTAWFEATPWIGRYAWFANRLSGANQQAVGWQSCSLLNPTTGVVTSLGQLYAQY